MAQTSRSSAHDKVATHLAEILIRLNNGEKFDPRQLAKDFGVTRHIIQRDLLERLAFLPFSVVEQKKIPQSQPCLLGGLYVLCTT